MIYKQAQLDSYLKKNNPEIKAFLLYGSNEGLVVELSKKLILTVTKNINDPFSVVYLSWDDIKSDTGVLSSEYNAMSLMGDRRVIILRDADNDLTKTLKEILPNSNSDTLLIICGGVNLNNKSSLVNFASNSDFIACFACYDDREENIASSTRALLIERGITYTTDAFKILCSRLSSDRKFNANEIEKLITYVGTKKHIEQDDVKEVVFDQSSLGTDYLCFYTFSGKKIEATKSLKHLLQEDVEPVQIIRALIYHTNSLLEGKALIERGETSLNAIKKVISKRLFYRYDMGAAQLDIWSKDRLFDVMELLYKAEKSCKTNHIPNKEFVSYTILTLLSAATKLK